MASDREGDGFLEDSSSDEVFDSVEEEELADSGEELSEASGSAANASALEEEEEEFDLDDNAEDSVLDLGGIEDEEDGIFEPKVSLRDWIHLHNKGIALSCGALLLLMVALVAVGVSVGLAVGLTSGSGGNGSSSDKESSAFEDAPEPVLQFDTWPNFRGGMGHSGFSILNTTSPSGKKWSQRLASYDPETQSLALGEPVLHPSGIYIIPYQVEGSSARLIAMDVHSGGEPWHYTSHEAFLSNLQVNPDGFIVANSNAKKDTSSSRIVLLSAGGDVIMEHDTLAGEVIVSSVVALSDSLIFMVKQQGEAVDAYTLRQIGIDGAEGESISFTCQLSSVFVDATQEERGFYDSGYSRTYGAPITLSESQKHLYVSCGGLTDARVLAFKTVDLSPHAEYRLPSGANGERTLSMPTISGNTLFVVEEYAGVLFAFDISSHEELFPPVVLRNALGEIAYHSTGFMVADQVNEDHVIFRGRSSDQTSFLASVDASQGVGRWSIHIKASSWWQAPIIVDDATSSIFLPTDSKIFRIDANSGMQLGAASVQLGSSSAVGSQVGIYVSEEFSTTGELTLHSLRREEF